MSSKADSALMFVSVKCEWIKISGQRMTQCRRHDNQLPEMQSKRILVEEEAFHDLQQRSFESCVLWFSLWVTIAIKGKY